MGLGDYKGRGIDHIAIPGLVRRFVGSHFVLSPRQQGLLARGEVEAVGSATAASSSIPTLPSGSARNSGGIVVVEVKRTVARGAIPAGRVRTGQAAENALLHGTISLLYREIAARRPGLFTDIGLDVLTDQLGLFPDPDLAAHRMRLLLARDGIG